MLPPALRRDVRHRPLQELQQGLLNTLSGDIAGDGGILALSCDLVDFVDVDDAALGAFDVKFGSLQELDNDVFHILADIAGFGQCRGIRNGEGNVQHFRHGLGKERFAAAGGSDQQDVALLKLDVVLHTVKNPLVVIVHRHREDLFRAVLADHILIQICFDLYRLRKAVKCHRESVVTGHRFGVNPVPDDAHAHPDAVVTDIAAVSRDQPVDLSLRFPAE